MKEDIYIEELALNMQHQNIKLDGSYTAVGYEVEKGQYVFTIIIPNIFKKKEVKKWKN